MNLNQRVYMACVEMVVQRINQLEAQLEDLRTQLGSEEKSTAGDKHETGRAMLHLEQEQISKQLYEANAQLSSLKSNTSGENFDAIRNGNLVETTSGFYYLGIGLGRIKVYQMDVMAISTQSPLGKALLGRKTGEELMVLGRVSRILSIS